MGPPVGLAAGAVERRQLPHDRGRRGVVAGLAGRGILAAVRAAGGGAAGAGVHRRPERHRGTRQRFGRAAALGRQQLHARRGFQRPAGRGELVHGGGAHPHRGRRSPAAIRRDLPAADGGRRLHAVGRAARGGPRRQRDGPGRRRHAGRGRRPLRRRVRRRLRPASRAARRADRPGGRGRARVRHAAGVLQPARAGRLGAAGRLPAHGGRHDLRCRRRHARQLLLLRRVVDERVDRQRHLLADHRAGHRLGRRRPGDGPGPRRHGRGRLRGAAGVGGAGNCRGRRDVRRAEPGAVRRVGHAGGRSRLRRRGAAGRLVPGQHG